MVHLFLQNAFIEFGRVCRGVEKGGFRAATQCAYAIGCCHCNPSQSQISGAEAHADSPEPVGRGLGP